MLRVYKDKGDLRLGPKIIPNTTPSKTIAPNAVSVGCCKMKLIRLPFVTVSQPCYSLVLWFQ